MSIGLSAPISPCALTPKPSVEDQLRTDPGGKAAVTVMPPTVSWVGAVGGSHAVDSKLIARFVGTAQAADAPPKSATTSAKMFLIMDWRMNEVVSSLSKRCAKRCFLCRM